jgi:pyruvate formate lyase activating enzyme
MNDSREEVSAMLSWVKQNLGSDIPIHFSRFYPQYRMNNVPPTPAETMEMCRTTAREMGFPYVYLGNLRRPGGEDTLCPNPQCPQRETPLIARAGFQILSNRWWREKCPACGASRGRVWA